VLRTATPVDLDALISIAGRPDIAKTLATDVVADLTAALEHEPGELLVIEDDGALAGGVRWVLANRRSRIASIHSLMIHPGARGRGLATAAIRELAERLFTVHWLHRVEAEVYGFNHAAQRVFEAAGFVREGVRRRAYDREDGWQDGVRYGLLSDDPRP
jgi:RimJ/RimL family protein N-acetyltransferase